MSRSLLVNDAKTVGRIWIKFVMKVAYYYVKVADHPQPVYHVAEYR